MIPSLLASIPLGLLLVARGHAWLGFVAASAAFLGGWAYLGADDPALVMMLTEWRAAAGLAVLCAAVTGIPALRRRLITKRALRRESKRLEGTRSTSVWAEPTKAERWFAAGRPGRALGASKPHELEFAVPPEINEVLDGVLADASPAAVRAAGGLPHSVWNRAANSGLLGLAVPSDMGGRGLSPAQLSTVVARAASRCLELGEILAMSGPGGFADLVQRFGSDAQREELLPILARGEALGALSWTGVPASIAPQATVVKRDTPTGESLGLELDIRFDGIELAPVAGIFAVMVETYDPENLLGRGERIGATCVLVRAGVQGLEQNGSHNAIGSFTAAGPIEARGLFVALEDILGGDGSLGFGEQVREDSIERAHGWAIPALSSGALQSATLAASAFAQLRLRPTAPQSELARLASAAFAVEGLRTGLAHLFNRVSGRGQDSSRPGRSLAGAARVACAAEVHEGLRAARTVLGRAATFHGTHNPTARWTGVETRLAALFGEADGAEHSLAVDDSGALLMALDGLTIADAARAGDLDAYDAAWMRRASRGASLWARSILRSFLRALPVPRLRRRATLSSRIEDVGLAFATVADTVGRRIHAVSEETRPEVARSINRALASLLGAASSAQLHRVRNFQAIEKGACDEALHARLEDAEDALDRIAGLMSECGAARTLRPAIAKLTRPKRPGRLAVRVRAADDLLNARDVRTRLAPVAFMAPNGEQGMGALEQAAGLSYAARVPLARIEQAMRDGQIAWGPLLGALDEAVSRGIVSSQDRDNVLASDASLDGIATFEAHVESHTDAA